MKMRDYLQQKKSENYQDAEAKGLLKAGAVATLLSKKFNTKISAKELIPFSSEWHHAGIFKVGERLKGKRVYFFDADDIENIPLEKILQNREKAAATENVQGWYPQFFKMTDPVTRRTSSKPFLGIYKGPANKAPKGFKALNEEQFTVAEKQRGRVLKPFEQCKF
jgi:hypothetical protein